MLLIKVFFIVISILYTKADATVKVSVYYETLCPDSIAFINTQLNSNFEAFGEKLIQLEFIPYGFAKETDTNGNKSFTCQHGPNECFGNLIHGIVANTQPIATTAKFVYCSESSDPPTSEENLKKCAEENGISWSEIEEMESNGKGADIMSTNGQKTEQLSPVFIPSIVFNDKFNQEDQDQSIDDFKGVVCKYLNYEPTQCTSRKNYVNIIQI